MGKFLEMILNADAPLGLPIGSIRAILSISIVIGSLILFGFGKISFEQFGALTGAITAFYFIQRKDY